jgi:hypothetical protein
MAKKNKKPKRTAVVSPTAPVQQPVLKTTATTQRSSALIVFDKKARIFIFTILFLYFIFSLFKIHTSSIANWDSFYGLGESESVLAGKPRFIRVDEWMVSTPSAISQYNSGLPVMNEALGAGNTPVVWGLPVKDISTLLRPNFWSYFFMDVEHAFAFSWNFNICFFLISTFLLFLLLTRNNFWLSVAATVFIFLSGGIQWWSYTIAIHMMYLNGIFISVTYFLYSKKLRPLIFSSLIFILSFYGFIFNLYPPFQVPLVYLYFALFIGFLLQRKNLSSIKNSAGLKIIVAAAALIILGVFVLHYYNLVKDTYKIMLNTAYPGKRFSTGGDLINGKLFAEFYGMYMTDTAFPAQWLNICEISGFIIFFPIVFYMMGYNYFTFRKVDPLLVMLSLFVIAGLIYVLVGFPAFLSKATLFSMSPSFRALPIIELGNCFLLVCYLGNNNWARAQKFSWIEFAILSVSIFAFFWLTGSHVNKATENYFSSDQVTMASLVFTIVYLLIRYKDYKFAMPALYFALFALNISNLSVNPLTKGLSPILENPLVKLSKEIHDKDPEPRWVLFGENKLTHLLKANGIKVFNGVKFLPALNDMRVLDPLGKNDSVYNRYAWITMQTYINWNDTIGLTQTYVDSYTITMDPCSPRLKQLGIKYIVFTYKPQEPEIRCMTKVGETSGYTIYKRNDQ